MNHLDELLIEEMVRDLLELGLAMAKAGPNLSGRDSSCGNYTLEQTALGQILNLAPYEVHSCSCPSP